MLLFGGQSLVVAQDSTTSDDDVITLEEMVITGYPAALIDAQVMKREVIPVVDLITSEDLGEYTDENLAESLQRIPGVQIGRSESGEGEYVSIRGLGPNFNFTSINRRGVRGGASGGNRNAYGLDNVPPEMVSGVTIYKSPTAILDEGGIGGVINIETPKPLDVQQVGRDLSFRGSADWSYNVEAETFDPRLSGLAIWTPNEKFGILASVAYSDRTTLTQIARLIQTDSNDTVDGIANVLRPGANSQYQVNDGSIEKIGYGLTAQWKPSTDWNLTVDWMTNESDTRRQQNNMRHRTTGNGSTILNPVVIATPDFPRVGGILDSATFSEGFNGIRGNGSAIQGVGTYTTFLRNDDVYGLNLEWNPNQGPFKFVVDVARSESEFDRDNRILTINFNDVPDGFEYRRNVDGMPFFEFLPNSVTGERYNPEEANATLGNLGYNVINYGSQEDIIAFDAEWDAQKGGDNFMLSKVYAGFKYRERSTDQVFNTFRFNANARRNILAENGLTEADVPAFTTFRRDFPSPAGGFLSEIDEIQTRTWFSPDNQAIYDYWQPLLENSSSRPDHPDGFFARDPSAGGNAGQGRYEQAEEEVTAYYFMADFEGALGQIRYQGNIGVRYHNTEVLGAGFNTRPQTSSDRVTGPGDFVYDANDNPVSLPSSLVTDTASYDDWLPSMTISFDLTDELKLRIAASSVIARPSLGNIAGSSGVNPSFEFGSTDVDGVNINSNNVGIPPFKADQWEAILEWYMGDSGAFAAVGYFNKDIKSFIFTESFSPAEWTVGGVTYVDSDTFDVQVNAPTSNAEGAKITGVEFQVHIPFRHFTDEAFISDFGFQGSYTKLFDNETALSDPITGSILPLVGASEDNYSAVFYYQGDKFSWRTSYTYRSRNLVSPRTQGGALFDEDYKAWDMNFTYRINKNVSVRLQARNLLEQARKQTFADGLFPYSYSQNGRSYVLGVRFRY
ncbi:MAG: TonB-dependent receptor [Opitutales bacterium]|nr:TonB-dependent receptor [Opitutales bacterium]